MRVQVLAAVIALGSSLSLAACEWVYPSVSLNGADGGESDVNGGPGGSSSGSGAGSSAGGSSGSFGAGSSSGGGSSGTIGASSSGAQGTSSSGIGGGSGSGAGSGGGTSSGSGSGALEEAGANDASALAIKFVQVASQDTNNNSVASISATYPSSESAGDLNVVVVGWANPANQINAISDSAGNTYVLTTTPGTTTDGALAIYYATRIASASSNTVTVDLSANDFICLAILEYGGASALDQTAVSTGMGSTASTSTITTAVPGELVIGAGEPDQKQSVNFSTAGPGFSERAITSISGMLAEDMIAGQPGSYNASGGLTDTSPWVMQVVTFK